MSELQRLLRQPSSVPVGDETLRMLQFYRMVVELEQLKEPAARDWFDMPWRESKAGMLLARYADNEDFVNACIQDRQNRFPQDVSVGLFVRNGDEEHPLLLCVHAYADIQDDDPKNPECELSCPLSDFIVNPSAASDMELEEEQVDALNAYLHEGRPTPDGLGQKLMELLGEDVSIVKTLRVALTSKNPSLSQLVSELKTLGKEVRLAGNVADFLENRTFENGLEVFDPDELVPLTDMDAAQRNAVAMALGNNVSVVTGPPGCGKTQVILNLVANAILKGKSVLVSSKNNKAVDNVLERLNGLPGLEYFGVRFGSRTVKSAQTLPRLQSLLGLAQMDNARRQRALADQGNARYCHEQACSKLKSARRLIARRDELNGVLPIRERTLVVSQQALTDTRVRGDAETAAFLSENAPLRVFDNFSGEALDVFVTAFRARRNEFSAKYSGFGKIWINWFTRRRHAAEAIGHVLAFPTDVRRLVEDRVGRYAAEEMKSGNEISDYYRGVDQVLTDGEAYLRERADLEARIEDDIAHAKERVDTAEKALEDCRNELKEIAKRKPDAMLVDAQNDIRDNAVGYVAADLAVRMSQRGAALAFSSFRNYVTDGIPWRREEISGFIDVTRNFLKACPLIAITSLSAKGALPLKSGLVDMLVIDEASQCDVASALPLMFRARQVVVIGDPKQLRHISALKDDEERTIKKHLGIQTPWTQYAATSLWDRCHDWLTHARGRNKPMMLNGHYRCHPQIIEYSNKFFYRELGGLDVHTGTFSHPIKEQGCFWVNVNGRQVSNRINANVEEVRVAIAKAVELARADKDISIGIVTPFKAQAERLHHAIPKEFASRITASTVHKFQGDERDVMIYSLVVTDNSPSSKIRWVDEGAPNLVNVAVTRARQALYVFGNRTYVRAHSSPSKPLGALLAYIESVR